MRRHPTDRKVVRLRSVATTGEGAESRHQRSILRLAAVQALAAALAATQRDTAVHCWEVARIAAAVCGELGIVGRERESTVIAARLHDIGKITVSLDILEKADALASDERAAVEGHAAAGARIARAFPELEDVAELIHRSHEHWDGSGYPGGLVGNAIPRGSRVILCADALEAMCSDRAYQAARAPGEALRVLEANAGRQFDPRVVAALLAAIAAAIANLGRHGDVGVPARFTTGLKAVDYGADRAPRAGRNAGSLRASQGDSPWHLRVEELSAAGARIRTTGP